MDLSYIQELLDSFSTFTGAIGDFLQLPAQIISDVLDFLGEENSLTPDPVEDPAAGEGEAPGLDLSSAIKETSSIVGSSEDETVK